MKNDTYTTMLITAGLIVFVITLPPGFWALMAICLFVIWITSGMDYLLERRWQEPKKPATLPKKEPHEASPRLDNHRHDPSPFRSRRVEPTHKTSGNSNTDARLISNHEPNPYYNPMYKPNHGSNFQTQPQHNNGHGDPSHDLPQPFWND